MEAKIWDARQSMVFEKSFKDRLKVNAGDMQSDEEKRGPGGC